VSTPPAHLVVWYLAPCRNEFKRGWYLCDDSGKRTFAGPFATEAEAESKLASRSTSLAPRVKP
jgi:hypothetical protein